MTTSLPEHPFLTKVYKYTIIHTKNGARVQVHGDDLSTTVQDYIEIITRLKEQGFAVEPDESDYWKNARGEQKDD